MRGMRCTHERMQHTRDDAHVDVWRVHVRGALQARAWWSHLEVDELRVQSVNEACHPLMTHALTWRSMSCVCGVALGRRVVTQSLSPGRISLSSSPFSFSVICSSSSAAGAHPNPSSLPASPPAHICTGGTPPSHTCHQRQTGQMEGGRRREKAGEGGRRWEKA